MNESKKPCLICCGILREEVERLISLGEIDADPFFLSSDFHRDYSLIEKALSGAIEKKLKTHPGNIVVAYGDVCMGFNDEMKALIDRYGVVKIDALNCIDCQLGGKGKLLDIDSDHTYLFLNPAFIEFGRELFLDGHKESIRKTFSMLTGIVLIDALGNLDDYSEEIETVAENTGLPILERRDVGLDGVKAVIREALERLK